MRIERSERTSEWDLVRDAIDDQDLAGLLRRRWLDVEVIVRCVSANRKRIMYQDMRERMFTERVEKVPCWGARKNTAMHGPDRRGVIWWQGGSLQGPVRDLIFHPNTSSEQSFFAFTFSRLSSFLGLLGPLCIFAVDKYLNVGRESRISKML